MAKVSKAPAPPVSAVRTRRAYFDCRFGQLHVRTAFPTTGGFDEGVTLMCLHSADRSSRMFARFLGEIADERSVYAPDLPGCGESDGASGVSLSDAAGAVSDLARDLRLRQIDVLGFQFGAGAALELAASRPELVRRLILVSVPPLEHALSVEQECLVVRIKTGTVEETVRVQNVMPRAQFLDLAEYADDLFDAAPKTLAKQLGVFLRS